MSHIRNLLHGPGREREHLPLISSKVSATADEPVSKRLSHAPENITQSGSVATAPPVLPDIPSEQAHLRPENRLVYYDDPRSPAADRYRLLRMRLKEHWNAGKLKKLLVTGALAHDGKSTVVLNLATALAERGKRNVLVVEADLHHSSITGALRLKQWAGLTECLVDEATPPLSVIRRVEPLGWYLLAAGEPRRNPTELLQTPAFGNIIQKLTPCFDWILIDSPPVVPLTDSLSIQQHVDASLLVVKAGQTPREAVEQTIALLGKKNILGIVLNGIEINDHLYYQYYDRNRDHQDD